jgi:serine/threonine protein kinase
MEGRRLGPFEILREIGRGGMGTVYLARRADDLFQQQVAIKVVTPETSGAEVIRRFYQEREILASLQHPNIARIYDGGSTEEGWPYFVLEYVEGEPINCYCDEHKLNVTERLMLFEQVCAAVEYAHQRFVVHRDLKPSNVLVTKDGTAKLLDFGIAKLLKGPGTETTSLQTRTGLQLMTPEYASPEQVKGEPITTATDVYALGVVLYELLTGHRPYRLKSRLVHEILRVICDEEPTRPSTVIIERSGDTSPVEISRCRETTPAGLQRELSGELDAILLKSLQKDPKDRYRSAEQFREDINHHRNDLPIKARSPSTIHRYWQMARRHPSLALGAALLCLGWIDGFIKIDFAIITVITLFLAGAILALRLNPGVASLASKQTQIRLGVMMCLVLGFMGVLVHLTRLRSNQILSAITFIVCGHILVTICAYFSRRQWFGPLLMDLGSPLRRMRHILGWGQLAIGLFQWWVGDPGPAAIPLCLGVYFLLVGLKVEIRESGFLSFNRVPPLIRWCKIQSYWWEQNSGSVLILRLGLERKLSFLPAAKVLVASGSSQLFAVFRTKSKI